MPARTGDAGLLSQRRDGDVLTVKSRMAIAAAMGWSGVASDFGIDLIFADEPVRGLLSLAGDAHDLPPDGFGRARDRRTSELEISVYESEAGDRQRKPRLLGDCLEIDGLFNEGVFAQAPVEREKV